MRQRIKIFDDDCSCYLGALNDSPTILVLIGALNGCAKKYYIYIDIVF